MRLKKQAGFTIVETLFVFSLIALLSTIILSSIGSARDKARTAAIEQTVGNYAKQATLERYSTGAYPAEANSLGWINDESDCQNIIGYQYADRYRKMCESAFYFGDNDAGLGTFFMARDEEDLITVAVASGSDQYYCKKGSGPRIIATMTSENNWPEECDPTGTFHSNNPPVEGPNQNPTVNYTGPISGTIDNPITLSATATDSDGTIAYVNFSVNSSVVGSDVSSPYQQNWTPTSSGTYSITVQATDDDGASATDSQAVTVTDPEGDTTIIYTGTGCVDGFEIPSNPVVGSPVTLRPLVDTCPIPGRARWKVTTPNMPEFEIYTDPYEYTFTPISATEHTVLFEMEEEVIVKGRTTYNQVGTGSFSFDVNN